MAAAVARLKPDTANRLKPSAPRSWKFNQRLDFRVSARGWCYILEEHGLGKGDFDRAERIINRCRKDGPLPLDICAEDDARLPLHLDVADASANPSTIEDEVLMELDRIENARRDAIESVGWHYKPFGFWHDQDFYIEMVVEKIDLKELFAPICRDFCIPIANNRGWGDINGRSAIKGRFRRMEQAGKQCVLLYCGDHDPAGLHISECLRSNLDDVKAVDWSAENLIIDRFGLNADFIETNRLTWIDGLETGSGRDLADRRHPDHGKPYVQDYLARFGARKVEANALVVRPDAGRELCRQAIARYVDPDAPRRYRAACQQAQEAIRTAVFEKLGEDHDE